MTTASIRVEGTDERVVLVVEGEIDMTNAREIERHLVAAVSNRSVSATVDARRIEYLDSAGLRILFTLADRLALRQIDLDMIVPRESPIRRAVELSGLASVLEVRESTG